MKTRTVLLAAGLFALSVFPRLQAAENTQDVWVAVLEDHLLVPVGALIDGVWRYEPSDSAGYQRGEMMDGYGQTRAPWAIGSPLPSVWQAYLSTGETTSARLNGPLDEAMYTNGMGVRTDLPFPSTGRARAFVTHGVAVAGAARVRVFTELPEASRPADVLRFLETPALDAERTAIKARGRSSMVKAEQWASLSDQAIAAGSFTIEDMRSIVQRDGSTLDHVEESKAPLQDCEVHVRATVVKRPSGSLHMTAIEAEPSCDQYVKLKPLAILDRGGVACWVTQQVLEDRGIFTLTRPGIQYVFEQSSCGIQ